MHYESALPTGSISPAVVTQVLERPVFTSVMASVSCRDDPDLRAFRVTDGPAAHECEDIRGNLLSGEAKPQTVVALREEGSTEILSLGSVWTGGRPEWAWMGPEPGWVKNLARTTSYVGLVARASDRERTVLADRETQLGPVTMLAVLELAIPEEARTPEALWAVTEKNNTRAHRIFRAAGFNCDRRSDKFRCDVWVRRQGKRLPAAPPLEAYVPLRHCTEHPLGA